MGGANQTAGTAADQLAGTEVEGGDEGALGGEGLGGEGVDCGIRIDGRYVFGGGMGVSAAVGGERGQGTCGVIAVESLEYFSFTWYGDLG